MANVNPLRFINEFMNDHPLMSGQEMQGLSRETLRGWCQDQYGIKEDQVELVIDCMMAAGIGNPAEQGSTVYCDARYM